MRLNQTLYLSEYAVAGLKDIHKNRSLALRSIVLAAVLLPDVVLASPFQPYVPNKVDLRQRPISVTFDALTHQLFQRVKTARRLPSRNAVLLHAVSTPEVVALATSIASMEKITREAFAEDVNKTLEDQHQNHFSGIPSAGS